MIKSSNYLKALIGFGLLLLEVTNSTCQDLSPSVVKIYSDQKYLCAGTLIQDRYVVTSAECLTGHNSILTVQGNVKIDEATAADESSVIGIFIHPDYNEAKNYMNVAVLKLKSSIVGSRIKSAELCTKAGIEEGEPVVLYFWDLRAHVPRVKAVDFNLRVLNLFVTDKDICVKFYEEKFSDTMFCAAGRDRNYFFYDSGGPATIDGQFCGIFHYGDKHLKGIAPGTLTSLANAEVIQFIKHSLEK